MLKECAIRNAIVTPCVTRLLSIDIWLILHTNVFDSVANNKYVAREKRALAKEGVREKERKRKNIAGVGSLARGGEVPAVRSPHSTDNVTFFNPRFTLFAPPSRSRGRPQTVIVRLLSLYRKVPSFATWKRREDKDDASLSGRQLRRRQLYVVEQSENSRTAVRVRANFVRGWHKRRGRRRRRIRRRRRRRRRREKEEEVGPNERRKEDMSAVESALDVLSRAATMVQGQFTLFGILCDSREP